MADNQISRTFPQAVHDSLAELRRIARAAKSRDDPRLRKATEDELALAVSLRKDWHCRGFSQRTSLPCTKARVTSLEYCRKHSGALPRMKALATRRLAALTAPALDALEHAITQRDNLLVSLKASQDALDRTGVGAEIESRIRAAEKSRDGNRIVVNIGFLTGTGGEPTTIVLPQQSSQALAIPVTGTPERQKIDG